MYFHLMPETKETIVTELEKIENQIKRLKEKHIEFNNKIYKIEYELMCTMIDGKVCRAITGLHLQQIVRLVELNLPK